MTRVISKIPVLGPVWDKVRKISIVGWLLDEFHLKRRFGLARPECVIMPNSHAPLYLNRREPRGRALLIDGAAGQPALKRIWHQANRQLKPEIVVDVGANYGEFLFGERYPDAVRVIGIEANSSLKEWLDKSLAKHPDCEKISLYNALAADKSDRSQSFFVDPTSSGRSSVICQDRTKWVERECKTVAVDDLVSDLDIERMGCLFKIDVEGYERFVMSGMDRLLGNAHRVFGIIEFNSKHIKQTGADPDEFLCSLGARFAIAALPHRGNYQNLPVASMKALQQLSNSTEVNVDLALMSEPNLISILDAAQSMRGRP